MLKLTAPILFFVAGVTGCTAVTSFGSYHAGSADDLSATVGDLGDGVDGGSLADLSPADAPPPDLTPVTCSGGAECCAQVPCAGGGCCLSGSCFPSGTDTSNGNVCVDGQSLGCGMPGQPCCGENVCHNGGCCAGGRCFANSAGGMPTSCPGTLGICTNGACVGVASTCGGLGDSCCPGGGTTADFCSESGFACVNGTCEQCAILPGGTFCCAGNWCPSGQCCENNTCIAVDDNCMSGKCQNGGCNDGKCGKLNQTCCGGTRCTEPLTRCNTTAGSCEVCGGLDQRCCEAKFCSEGFACDATDRCRRCGNTNQECCPGRLCGGNLTCNNSNLCL